MISNATSNAIGSKVTPGGSRSNPELITNGDFADGQEGWTLIPRVDIREGRASIGPEDQSRPPYAAIVQAILENSVSYNVVIDVVSVQEGGTFEVLDGGQNKVAELTAAGQKSFTFTNTRGSGFGITASRKTIVIGSVSVKKQ